MSEIPIIILGAGGHAVVLVELLKALSVPILGLVAPQENVLKNYPDIKYLGDDSLLLSDYIPQKIRLVNGLGAINVQCNQIRQALFLKFKQHGYSFATVVHPSAVVASSVTLGEGTQVMAGAVIQPNVIIGNNVIINTRASIDHDCSIGNNVHVAPGVTLSGNVQVSENAHIGTACAVIQNIKIGEQAMVCAGQVVLKDIASFQKIN